MCRMFAYLRPNDTSHASSQSLLLDKDQTSAGIDRGSKTLSPSVRSTMHSPAYSGDRSAVVRTLLQDFILLARDGNVLPGKSEGHLDGWGLAFLDEIGGDHWTLRKSASSALDPDHGLGSAAQEALQNISPQIVAHIRKASLGSVIAENSHPFIFQDKVFCHNGTVFKPEKFGEIGGLDGTTDSEKLFRYVMRELGVNGGTPVVDNTNYLQILKNVKRIAGYTSLTSILAEPGRLLAYRDYNHKNSGLRERVLGDYYTLYFAVSGDEVFVCSEPIGNPELGLVWREIKDDQMVLALSEERLKVGVISQ